MDIYVYALLRLDGSPFYIGIGSGDRWLQHEKAAHRKRSRKNNIIMKMRAAGISEIPKAKLADGLTRAVAMQIEMDLIQLIGRSPAGPLSNISGGGEGILNLSAECLALRAIAVAAAQRRPEVRAKRSRATKGRKLRPKSPEEREALRLAVSGFRHTEEARAKIAAAGTGRSPSAVTRQQIADSLRGHEVSEQTRGRIALALTGRKQSAETIEKRSAKARGRRHTAESIERMKVAQAKKDPATRARVAAATSRAWATLSPDERKRRGDAIRDGMRRSKPGAR